MDERIAQYLRLGSWLFCPTVCKELPYEAVSSPVVFPHLKSAALSHESKMDPAILAQTWKGKVRGVAVELVCLLLFVYC